MNLCTFIGNVTADVTVRNIASSNLQCANFTIAVDRPYSRDNGKSVDFIQVVAWDKNAENCARFLAKGSKVGVHGSLETYSYEKNGNKFSGFKINAKQVYFLSHKNEQKAPNDNTTHENTKDTLIPISLDDEEMPF